MKVTCLLTGSVGIPCQFPAKCLLPKASSQKSLYNSTSPSVCDCSLTLCASKMESGANKRHLCSLIQGDASVTSNKLAVSRALMLLTCDPPLLLWKQPAKFTVSICILGSGMQALKTKTPSFLFYFIYSSSIFLHNGSRTICSLCAFFF